MIVAVKVGACAVIIVMCLIIIYYIGKGIVTNEQNIHLMRYYAKKGYSILGALTSIINGKEDQSRTRSACSGSVNTVRLSSARIPSKFAVYAKMIEECISNEIKRYQNGQFMPIMHDSVKGGKRLRGAILLSIVDNSAREYLTAATCLAACIELMHCSSLVFDDIMDGDIYRRGLPSIYYKYGIGKAQMAGMLLLTSANNVMLKAFRSGDSMNANTNASIDTDGENTDPAESTEKLLPEEYKIKFSERILAAGKTLVSGQMRDLNVDNGSGGEDIDVLIDEKTSVLFRLIFELAYDIVHIGRASDAVGNNAAGNNAARNNAARNSVLHAGGLVGTGFQIADDFDDIVQDSESPGGMQKNYVLKYGTKAAQKRLDEIHKECITAFTEGGIINSDIEGVLSMICAAPTR